MAENRGVATEPLRCWSAVFQITPEILEYALAVTARWFELAQGHRSADGVAKPPEGPGPVPDGF